MHHSLFGRQPCHTRAVQSCRSAKAHGHPAGALCAGADLRCVQVHRAGLRGSFNDARWQRGRLAPKRAHQGPVGTASCLNSMRISCWTPTAAARQRTTSTTVHALLKLRASSGQAELPCLTVRLTGISCRNMRAHSDYLVTEHGRMQHLVRLKALGVLPAGSWGASTVTFC